MNISSIVVMVLPENAENVIDIIKGSDYCEYHCHQDGKIIVTIEGENTGDEIKKIRMIEKIPNVISASLHYSFCEDELEEEKEKLTIGQDFPQWLNQENIDIKDIPYNGNLKNRL